MSRKTYRWIFLLLALCLAGCASLSRTEQGLHESLVQLEPGRPVGQTFTARYAGLNGVEIYFEPASAGDMQAPTGQLVLHLRQTVGDEQDIAQAELALEEFRWAGYYRFDFPIQADSCGKDYALLLEMKGQGDIRIGVTDGEAYLDGSFYQGSEPADAQAAFHLVYDPARLALGLLQEGIRWAGFLLAAFFLYVIPGWGLVHFAFGRSKGLTLAERLTLSVGVSLALYPLLFLWCRLAGWQPGPLYAWIPPLAGLTALLWQNREQARQWKTSLGRKRLSQTAGLHLPGWENLSLLCIVIFIFAIRFWIVRSLPAPLWGDSVHHVMITQLLMDHGGLFTYWYPYADLQTFTYHFGFHSLAAVFGWLTHLPAPQAVLWSGQILNGLAAIALYPLAVRVGKKDWAGVFCVLAAGLLMSMPMYYVNWGRYAQLAGQVILPVAAVCTWYALEEHGIRWQGILLAVLTSAGLALTHYRIFIYLLLFFCAQLFIALLDHHPGVKYRKTTLVIFGAMILLLPWMLNLARNGFMLDMFTSTITTSLQSAPEFIQQDQITQNPGAYLPVFFWLTLPLILGWGMWRREKNLVTIALWFSAILVATNPGWLSLPGTGILSNFALLVALYIPAAIIFGAGAQWLLEVLPRPTTAEKSALAMLLVLGAGVWGSWQRSQDINVSEHAYLTQPDLQAFAWIQKNTSPEARFLVNTTLAFSSLAVVGGDAGWWLPLLAQRAANVPPVVYVFEESDIPDYRAWVNQLIQEIESKGIDHPQVIDLLRERDLDYIYIGQRQGGVNSPQSSLKPEGMQNSPCFELVYHQDRVWIIRLAAP